MKTQTKLLLAGLVAAACTLPAQATPLFSDEFTSFTLGSTWSPYGTAPNSTLVAATDGGRSVLQMDSTGGWGVGYGLIAGISTPVVSSAKLTITVVFRPAAGYLSPFEFKVYGSGNQVRFYNWAGQWASDGTGASQVVSGSFNNSTYYTAVFNFTSSGSMLDISDDSLNNVYSRSFGVTRADIGDTTQLIMRQLSENGTPGSVSTFVDSVTVEANVVGNRVWNGAGGNDNWSTSPNWAGGAAPGTGDSVTFAGTTRLTPSMDANFSLTGVTFNSTAGSFTVATSSSTLTLLGGGITNNSANTQTLNVPINISTAQTFNAAAGALTLGRAISGSGHLIKAGNSNLTLSAATDYTGNTTVNAGKLVVTQPALAPTSTIEVAANARLELAFVETIPVGGLMLGGVSKPAGVYNASTDPTYLSGTGSLLVVPVVATLFSDSFASFALGTTWSAYGTAPNSTLAATIDGGRSVLQMDSTGASGDGHGLIAAVNTPTASYADLTVTVVFRPAAGSLSPFEFRVYGAGNVVRFFTWSGQWASDATGSGQVASGSFNNSTYYTAVFNFTSSGSTLDISDGVSSVYSRSFDLTRADLGDTTQLIMIQLAEDSTPGSVSTFVDRVTVTVPAPLVATSPPTISYSISGHNLTLTWPADHIGWRLLSQTNLLNPNDWGVVPGSTTTNRVDITIDSAQRAGFYRLAY